MGPLQSSARKAQRALGSVTFPKAQEAYDLAEKAIRRRPAMNRDHHGSPTVVSLVIAEMTNRIVRDFDPLRIILFGSHARGQADASSDVDLLVVLSEVKDKRQMTHAIRRALADLTVCKDIVVSTPEEIACRGTLVGTVLRPALREGRVLYERS